MTVPDDLSALDEKPFAEAVVKFEELLAQSGRAFLIGAGCSKCAGLPLTPLPFSGDQSGQAFPRTRRSDGPPGSSRGQPRRGRVERRVKGNKVGTVQIRLTADHRQSSSTEDRPTSGGSRDVVRRTLTLTAVAAVAMAVPARRASTRAPLAFRANE